MCYDSSVVFGYFELSRLEEDFLSDPLRKDEKMSLIDNLSHVAN